MKLIGNNWDNVLSEEFEKPYFVETLKRLMRNTELAQFIRHKGACLTL